MAVRGSWSEPQSAPSLVFADCIESFSIFGCKEYNQPDFSIDYLVMFICRVFSCVAGGRCLLWSVYPLGKTLLAFALLHSVLQGLVCLLLQVFFGFLKRKEHNNSVGKRKDAHFISDAIQWELYMICKELKHIFHYFLFFEL